MSMELWMQLAGLVLVPLGVYGAIRADLATARVKAEFAEASAAKAHRRIDNHLDQHLEGKTP